MKIKVGKNYVLPDGFRPNVYFLVQVKEVNEYEGKEYCDVVLADHSMDNHPRTIESSQLLEIVSWEDLCNRKDWEEAVIVFAQESFKKPYSEQSRSYTIYANAKYFDSSKCGTSLFGDCLDGSEEGVRLDWYLGDWKIEHVFITK